nr:hypothetical protein [uncultured Butyrivibrio sp.]
MDKDMTVTRKEMLARGVSLFIIRTGTPLLILLLVYGFLFTHPLLLHKEHEYFGYKYFSSILNFDFEEADAEMAFDRILMHEPEYKWLLDSFYNDGYSIFFDDKLTYALCTVNFVNSTDFAACVTFDKRTREAVNGMFVNYENDNFSEVHFFHELSHYADWKMGYVSEDPEFTKIFEEEYECSGLGKYFMNPREYFAQESAYFIINDSYRKAGLESTYSYECESAPRTQEYIRARLENLESKEQKR